MKCLLLLFLASTALADPPNYLRGTNTNQAIGALNGNFIDQNTLAHNQLNTTISPGSCPAGSALTGAYYNNGYSFGGVCTAIPSSVLSYVGTISSCTTISPGSYTTQQTTFVQAVTGSTITLTTSVAGSTVAVTASGGADCEGNSCDAGISFLVDGGFSSGLSASKAASLLNLNGGSAADGIHLYWIVTGLSKGPHTFSLVASVNSITLRIGANAGAAYSTASVQFCATEVH